MSIAAAADEADAVVTQPRQPIAVLGPALHAASHGIWTDNPMEKIAFKYGASRSITFLHTGMIPGSKFQVPLGLSGATRMPLRGASRLDVAVVDLYTVRDGLYDVSLENVFFAPRFVGVS